MFAAAGAGVVVVLAAGGDVAGFPKENPPVVAGFSAVFSAARFGAPKLKPPAAGAGAAAGTAMVA